MKTQKFFALVGIFSAFIIFQPTVAARQEHQNLTETPNFVVIGAFAIPNNAKRFTEQVNKKHLHAQFMINPNRNLYYVYVLSTIDRAEAIDEALRLRKQPEFADTWVYNGTLGNTMSSSDEQMPSRGVDINPVTEQKIENVQQDDQSQGSKSAPGIVATTMAVESTQQNVTAETPPAAEQTSELDRGVEGANFYFKIFRADDNQKVEGDVDVIDIDRTRKVGTYKGNTGVKVTNPASKSGNVSLVCEVFGYRKVQRDVNYTTPEGDGIEKNENGAVIVPFELMRLQKGDVAVMYNVYFFKDASIMRPESRFEVTSLLDMLKENLNYKIKIHGHANGGAHGKIISMAKGSTSFFSLTDTKEGLGSSKELSEERATIIRDYLLANGIDAGRMQIKAWGGKRPIHDKHSARAQENVRVEIEILEN
jgi:outer membrane protein OmpA-like peptidoglycan-associated protein